MSTAWWEKTGTHCLKVKEEKKKVKTNQKGDGKISNPRQHVLRKGG